MSKSASNKVLVSMNGGMEAPSWFHTIEPFIQEVLKKLELVSWEVSILFCNDDFIALLNKEYRSIEGATDVLSFEAGDSYEDEEGVEWYAAGDIVISLDTLKKNSKEFSVSQDEELKRLLIHGILHLKGYDHSDNSPEQEMLQLQESILSNFLGENNIIIDK